MFKRGDRRIRRSDNPYQALCLQLEQTRREADLYAVVLATHQGLVVAASGEPEVCEELGAVAPLLGRAAFHPKLSQPSASISSMCAGWRVTGRGSFWRASGAGEAATRSCGNRSSGFSESSGPTSYLCR